MEPKDELHTLIDERNYHQDRAERLLEELAEARRAGENRPAGGEAMIRAMVEAENETR